MLLFQREAQYGKHRMREKYFTKDTLEHKGKELMASAQNSNRRGVARFKPASLALLVLDMQDYFFNPESHAFIPSGEAIVPGVCALIQAFRQRGQPVIFTQHLNTENNAGMMGRWWRDLLTASHPHVGIIPELDTSKSTIIQKSQYDAFYGTALEDILHQKGITQVAVSGVMTHLCCETTARTAFVRGFEVFFVVDGTATYEEAFHLASLRNLAHGFATLVMGQDILDGLKVANG